MARKKKISPKNRAAFDLLVRHFGGLDKTKEALGLKSRQVVHSWGIGGIPRKHWGRISKITGWSIQRIVPDPYS